MNSFKNEWFTEAGTEFYGQVLSIKCNKVLHEEKSPHQSIMVFESANLGNVLVLDNFIYCAEHTEFPYQEMAALLPLTCHPNPKDVLVIGACDGGVVREVVKHPKVKKVTHCELDEVVVKVCKQYFPDFSEGFKTPKAELIFSDGNEFMQANPEKFDVIISDYSDPSDQATTLIRKKFYTIIKKSLKPDGIFCSQGESIFFDVDLIKKITYLNKTLYPVVEYASIFVPHFLGGQIGFFLGSKNPSTNFREPLMNIHDFGHTVKFKYYSTEIHKSAFILPPFIKNDLEL